jgi:hypothetical protein
LTEFKDTPTLASERIHYDRVYGKIIRDFLGGNDYKFEFGYFFGKEKEYGVSLTVPRRQGTVPQGGVFGTYKF